MRTTLIENGSVVSVIATGGDYQPPNGVTAVASDTANIGDHYDGTSFSRSPAPAPSQADLVLYAERKQAMVAQRGITVNVGTQQAPHVVRASTDSTSIGYLNGAARQSLADPNFQATWTDTTGSVTLTAAQILNVDAAVTAYIQASFATLGTVLAAIDAGTITIVAQIDAAAWPGNS
jgi:hypothetical protein